MTSDPFLVHNSEMCVCFLFLPAFTKLITVNGQEYHLQLVDTAGQVSNLSSFESLIRDKAMAIHTPEELSWLRPRIQS